MVAYMHVSMIAFSFVGCLRRLDIVPLMVRQGIEQMSRVLMYLIRSYKTFL